MPSLTQRIEANQTAQRERPKVVDFRPVPMWRRRIERNLAKDLTPSFLNGSWTPSDEGTPA